MTHDVRNAEINLEQLVGFIPFIVAVDERLKVTWASEPVLRRVKGALGLEISEIIEPVEPREEISHSSIARNRGVKQDILLKNQGGPVPLTGEWFSFRDGFLLLAGPDVRRSEGLEKFSFGDFPEGDPTLELLRAREEYIGSLKEARSAVDALREKNRIIGESNQRLELANAELEKEITERERAEEALRQNEERLGLALRGGDLGTWDWNILTDEVRFNERWATMKGYTLGEVEPRLDSWENLVHPEDLPGVREKLNAHIEGETSFYEAEFRMRHKSGEWVWILDKGRVIEWDEDDNPVRACGTHLDITERKRARKKLEESYDIMNKSPVVVFLWRNVEGWPVEHVSENVKDLFGYTAEEFMSGKVAYASTVHPDDLERVGAEVSAYSNEEGRKEFSQEYRIITRDGNVEWTDDRTLIRRNEKGEITHYQGIVLSITERKRAEEALRESEAQKQAILDSSIDMIMLMDTQMRMVWANKNAAKMVNKDPKDLIGHTCYNFFQKTGKPCLGCPLEKAMKTGKIERATMYHPAMDAVGESYWDNYAVPLRDGSGRITGGIEIGRDVTERKRAEELLESRAHQQAEVARFGQLALSGMSLDGLFQRAAVLISKVLRTKYANISEHRPEQGALFLRAGVGWWAGRVGSASVPDGIGSQCGYTLLQDKPVISEDMRKETRFSPMPLLTEHNVVGGMTVAIPGIDRPFGVIGVYTDRTQRFSEDDAHFLEAVANLLAAAVQRTRTEESLATERRRLADILKGTNVGTWEWNVQTGETIFNERWADIIGYTLEEISPTAIETWMKFTHPDDLKMSGELLKRHFNGELEYYECEARMRHKGGDWVWVFDRGKVVTLTEEGKPLLMSGTRQDITERKRAEQETRRLATITEQAIEGIAVADFEGRIVFANHAWAEMHGYETGDELVGENLSIFHTEEQLKTDVIPFNEGVMRRGYNIAEIGHVRKDGTTFPTSMAVTVLKDEQGSPYALAAFMQDITERKKAEKDLKKAQTELIHTEKLASLGQLAAGIAHEINTPSQFVGDNIKFLQDAYQDLHKLISSLTELLSSVKQGNIPEGLVQDVEQAVKEADLDFLFEEIPKAIEQSQEGVQRIGHIVRSMKQFSHPGAKDKTLADINECIETTVTVCRNEWKYAADMATDLDRSMPPVPLYQNEFNQVVLNIILNAALAIKEKIGDSLEDKGTITITTGRDDEFVEVRIQDTGTGIPEKIRGKIFDPFFTSREVGKGTGQGLAISHSVIVEKHGGTLTFETEEGKGTTFIIRLPLE